MAREVCDDKMSYLVNKSSRSPAPGPTGLGITRAGRKWGLSSCLTALFAECRAASRSKDRSSSDGELDVRWTSQKRGTGRGREVGTVLSLKSSRQAGQCMAGEYLLGLCSSPSYSFSALSPSRLPRISLDCWPLVCQQPQSSEVPTGHPAGGSPSRGMGGEWERILNCLTLFLPGV